MLEVVEEATKGDLSEMNVQRVFKSGLSLLTQKRGWDLLVLERSRRRTRMCEATE